ncbi:MAG TPA: LLM class flavin-dependent oxidoreductase [Tepidiformaceae bacterium]|nr:LLM class flavin-dependent oxidoreductase [Tepidiformaceae bacterium]
MKIGLFYILQQPEGKSASDVYADNLEQFRVADELGFDELFLGEHRISQYGTLPNPLVLAGAISQVTKRIRIGTAVTIPAFNHPVRVAEDVAMVDVLTSGRFDLGVGRGYQRREFEAMGVNQDESAPRFYESVEIIDQLLHNEHVTYHGKFWDVNDVTVYPRPQGKVSIGVAVFKTQATFDFAVSKGYTILAGNPYSIQPEIEGSYKEYLAALRRAGHAEDTEKAWGLAGTFVDPDRVRARTTAFADSQAYMAQLGQHGSVTGPDGKIPLGYEQHADTWWKAWGEHLSEGAYDLPSSLVGTPDEVIEKLHRMHEEFGFKNVIMTINQGGTISQRDVLKTYELIAAKVMPAVRHLGAAQPVTVP